MRETAVWTMSACRRTTRRLIDCCMLHIWLMNKMKSRFYKKQHEAYFPSPRSDEGWWSSTSNALQLR
jgi:hypothetical protein